MTPAAAATKPAAVADRHSGSRIPLRGEGEADVQRAIEPAGALIFPPRDSVGVAVGSLALDSDVDQDQPPRPHGNEFWSASWPDRFGQNPENPPEQSSLRDARKGGFVPAVAGKRVFLLTCGPMKESGQAWRPAELWRDGSTFTLVVEEWTDHHPRFGNVPFKSVDLIALGRLPAGQYSLRVEWRVMEFDEETHLGGYQWPTTRTAACPFAVRSSDRDKAPLNAVPAGKPVWLDLSIGVAQRPGPAVASASSRREHVEPLPFRLSLLGSGGAAKHPRSASIAHWVTVGTFDPEKWDVDLSKLLWAEDRPRLSDPDAMEPIYASVICPLRLHERDWVALRAVTREANDVTIEMDILRTDVDGGGGGFYGGVIVRLDFLTARGEKGAYILGPRCQVRVKWHVLRDIGSTGPRLSAEEAALLERAATPVSVTVP